MLDFPGVGRIIERHEPEEPAVQDATKELGTTAAPQLANELTSASTRGDLSGRCLSDETHISPSRVSPDEAQLICQSVLTELGVDVVDLDPSMMAIWTPREAELETPRDSEQDCPDPDQECQGTDLADVDLASVKVIACDRGCISGSLEWLGRPSGSRRPEKVLFTLQEIRPGYTVVGEALEGPKLLGSLCWKLQSINGSADSRPAWIRRGDVLVLEGPRWATKRLLPPGLRSTLPKTPETRSPEASGSVKNKDRSPAALPSMSVSTPPQIAKPSHTVRSPLQAALKVLEYEPTGNGFSEVTYSEVTSGSNADRPVIPVLDLDAVNRRREQRMGGQQQPPRGIGVDFNGCDFGWLECSIMPSANECNIKTWKK